MSDSPKKENYQLQIIISSGKDNISKAILGFAFALSAASVNTSVVIFFTMEGACWTDSEMGHDKPVEGFESIETYWNLLAELGADFEGCTSCVENYCNDINRVCTPRHNMILAGLSSAAIRSFNTQTIVF